VMEVALWRPQASGCRSVSRLNSSMRQGNGFGVSSKTDFALSGQGLGVPSHHRATLVMLVIMTSRFPRFSGRDFSGSIDKSEIHLATLVAGFKAIAAFMLATPL